MGNRTAVLLCLAGLACLPQTSRAQDAATVGIAHILVDTDAYNGKRITVVGIVTRLKYKTSPGGDAYVVFRLRDENGSGAVSVLSNGSFDLSNGQRVTVIGVFQKTVGAGRRALRNVIAASQVN